MNNSMDIFLMILLVEIKYEDLNARHTTVVSASETDGTTHSMWLLFVLDSFSVLQVILVKSSYDE